MHTMYTFSNFELTDVCSFQKFAEAFTDTFKLSHFRRINDTTISWSASVYGINAFGVTPPEISITFDFDGNNNGYFIMKVRFGFSKTLVYCNKFNSPMAAIDYLNRCVNVIKNRKKRINSIWEEYGF